MSLNFDNDGPPIQLKEINSSEVRADKIRYTNIEIIAGAAQAAVLALIALCIAIMLSDKSIWIRLAAGMGFTFGLSAVLFYFVRQWARSKEAEQLLKNQQSWEEDQEAIHRLVGHDFVLSPSTSTGKAKLRIFYQDNTDMLNVWYSKGIYTFKKTTGEGSIDFSNGIVMVPKFVQVPAETWPKQTKQKEVHS